MRKYIYIAKPDGHDGVFKVGVSRFPDERMIALKNDYGCSFELLHREPVDYQFSESVTKKRLAEYLYDGFGSHRTEVFRVDYGFILDTVKKANDDAVGRAERASMYKVLRFAFPSTY